MAITRPTYATREAVMRALDSKETARNAGQIDRAIESASDSIDGGRQRGKGTLGRRFYPEHATRYKSWPNSNSPTSWKLWLDADELISVTSLVAGGTTIAASDYFLEPANEGPPYNCIEIDLSSSAAFAAGDTSQRAIAITGVFGYGNETAVAATLAEALDASETGVDVTDSSGVGVGDLVVVGTEYMLVTGKAMLDTGVDIHSSDSLTAATSDVSITVSTATNMPTVDEVILIDSERMLVVDVAGTTLTVKRAWDGSTLAAHSANASIYAPRTLTVVRGSVGTTAATHDTATTVYRHVVPPLVRSLCVAEALVQLLGEAAGMARTAGSGDNEREVSGRALVDLRRRAVEAFGRGRARHRAV